MQRASLLGQAGHQDEAVKQLQEMLNNTPEDRDIYLAIAQIYSQAKPYPKAEAVINKALALSDNPDDQEYARFMLGSVYERQKKYDLAEEQFKKVLAVDPLNDAAANYLGYMLADRGVRLEESVRYIKDALKIEPNNGAYLDSLGWAYYKMKRNDAAQVSLQKAVQLISNDPTIREHLGYVYLALGKKAKALQEWEHALKFEHKEFASRFRSAAGGQTPQAGEQPEAPDGSGRSCRGQALAPALSPGPGFSSSSEIEQQPATSLDENYPSPRLCQD